VKQTRSQPRANNRKADELRKIKIELDYLDYPAGSCLITMGKTRVLCAVTVENKVPHFLVNSGTGWLTAEYQLLPCSTQERVQREANTGRLKGRTQEIRRFIGRSMRPIFNLSAIGERTFIIDCDVIQADGGTRTAAVNGAYIALCSAVNKMMHNHTLRTSPIIDSVAAISVGIVRGEPLLDLDYDEDCNAEMDMNIVMTGQKRIIEMQATAERCPVAREDFDRLIGLGIKGIEEIIVLEKKFIGKDRV